MPVGEGWELDPAHKPWSDFHWWKVPVKGSLVLVLVGKSPIYYTGHYVDGRMWPCQGEGCDMCEHGIGAQVRFIMAACEISTRRVGILEVGKSNGLLIRDWAQERGELGGTIIELSKHSHARTSRTEIIRVDRECPPWYRMVELPDLKRALLLTWDKAHMPIPPGMR